MSQRSISPSPTSAAVQRPAPLPGRLGRVLELLGGVGVRTKILGMILTLTIVLGLGVTLQVRLVMRQALLAELDNRGYAVTSDLAGRSEDLLERPDVPGLTRLFYQTAGNHDDILYAFVLDAEGKVVTYYGYLPPPAEVVALAPVREPNHAYTYVSRYYEGPVHDFAQPVRNGTLGEIRLGLSEMRIDGVVAATTLRMILITGFVAGLGVLAATFLTWLLTRPILDLVHTTEQVRQGNFAARAPRWTDDEIGELADAFNRMVRELARSRQTIQEKEAARSKLLSSLINAQEEERKRIARDLHDGIGQALTSLLVNLKLIEQADTLQRAQQIAGAMRTVTSETLEDARTLSRDLRPSALDDLGLVPALERYVAELASRYPQLELDLHATLSERLPSPVETSLYRIVQEALTNAARHSGATTIAVVLGARERSLQAIVEDNGHGFDVTAARRSGASAGLHNMAERAELLGGKLSIESNRNGTTVYIEIPVRDEHE